MLGIEQSHCDHQSIIEDETSIKGTVNWSVWAYLFSQSFFGWIACALLIVLSNIGTSTIWNSQCFTCTFTTQNSRSLDHKLDSHLVPTFL